MKLPNSAMCTAGACNPDILPDKTPFSLSAILHLVLYTMPVFRRLGREELLMASPTTFNHFDVENMARNFYKYNIIERVITKSWWEWHHPLPPFHPIDMKIFGRHFFRSYPWFHTIDIVWFFFCKNSWQTNFLHIDSF